MKTDKTNILHILLLFSSCQVQMIPDVCFGWIESSASQWGWF